MPVKISLIKILTDLGYEMVDIESDEDYLSALMEAIVTLQRAGASGRARADILQEELIRVRKERKAAAPSAGMKVTQKKISTSKFFDKGEQKSPVQGKSSQEKGGALVKIDNSVTSIVETLKEDQKQDKKQQGWFRKMVERFKRRKKENKLEFKVFDGIKKTASKALAPLKSAWSKLLEFLGKVFLGRVLFKILEWMGNKKNQGKLKSIIKFLKDWWPSMLAGYLLFGTGFTKMVGGIIKVVGWGIGKLTILIPKLIAAVGKLKIGKIMKGLGGLLGGGLGGKGKAFTGLFNLGTGAFAGGGLVEEVQYYKQGGFVSGPGGVDKVPARLTAGEFVMSKGAVQKYGANTLAAMNAAGGGTNRPTMGRYETGGDVVELYNKEFGADNGKNEEKGIHQGMSTEDLLAAIGPSVQAFMDQHNSILDSDPEFFNQNTRLYMDRDGKMINFGRTVANMSEWGFNHLQDTVMDTEAIPPELKEAFLKKMNWIRKGTLDNPNFKTDLAFDVNKDIPGTAAHRLFLAAQEDTTSIAAKGGISAYDRAKLMNRRGLHGGGLVQNFQGGGLVTVKAGTIKSYQDAIDAGIVVNDEVAGNTRSGSIYWIEEKRKGLFGKDRKRHGTKWMQSGTGRKHEADLAMTTRDFVNKKMGWKGKVVDSQKTPPKLDKVTGDPGKRTAPQLDRGGNITSNEETKPDLTPVDKKTTKVIDAYNKEKSKMEDKPMVENSAKEIPKFDALGGRSAQKIKVLGISV